MTRVLVIDDDPSLLNLIRLSFISEGFEVMAACNGLEGLSRLDGVDFDAIVLDLQMPIMDGRSFYREVRSRGIEVPVLLLSAFGAEEARQELNAEDALPKPFDPDVLIRHVRLLTGMEDPYSGN